MGRGWICAGHEAVGGWKLPVASEQRRGSEVKLPAVSLIVKSIENDNFPGNFYPPNLQKQDQYTDEQHGDGNALPCGIG